MATISPALRELREVPMTPPSLEPAAARFALASALASLLRVASRDRLLVLVLDDVHDADIASGALLELVAPELRHLMALVVVTHREVELSRRPELIALYSPSSWPRIPHATVHAPGSCPTTLPMKA